MQVGLTMASYQPKRGGAWRDSPSYITQPSDRRGMGCLQRVPIPFHDETCVLRMLSLSHTPINYVGNQYSVANSFCFSMATSQKYSFMSKILMVGLLIITISLHSTGSFIFFIPTRENTRILHCFLTLYVSPFLQLLRQVSAMDGQDQICLVQKMWQLCTSRTASKECESTTPTSPLSRLYAAPASSSCSGSQRPISPTQPNASAMPTTGSR